MEVQWLRLIVVLAGIFVILPVILFFGIRGLLRRVWKVDSASSYSNRVTTVGLIVYGCQTLIFVLLMAAYSGDPNGTVGSFLHKPGALVGAFVISGIGVGLVGKQLAKRGHALLRRHESDV